MNLTESTSAQDINNYLRDKIYSYIPECRSWCFSENDNLKKVSLRCFETALKFSGIKTGFYVKERLLWNMGVRVIDLYNDLETHSEAVRFHLKSENAEAHLLLRKDATISLKINDISPDTYREGYVKQRIRIPDEDTTRSIYCYDAFSLVVMVDLIMETKW